MRKKFIERQYFSHIFTLRGIIVYEKLRFYSPVQYRSGNERALIIFFMRILQYRHKRMTKYERELYDGGRITARLCFHSQHESNNVINVLNTCYRFTVIVHHYCPRSLILQQIPYHSYYHGFVFTNNSFKRFSLYFRKLPGPNAYTGCKLCVEYVFIYKP